MGESWSSIEAINHAELLRSNRVHHVILVRDQRISLFAHSLRESQENKVAVQAERNGATWKEGRRGGGGVDGAGCGRYCSIRTGPDRASKNPPPRFQAHFIYQLITCLAFAKWASVARRCRGFGGFIGQISSLLEPRSWNIFTELFFYLASKQRPRTRTCTASPRLHVVTVTSLTSSATICCDG